jgi:hypothetical protein
MSAPIGSRDCKGSSMQCVRSLALEKTANEYVGARIAAERRRAREDD